MSCEKKEHLYIGSRYVPQFEGKWDVRKDYENLSIVQDNEMVTWISSKNVPAGTDLSNSDYWFRWTPYTPPELITIIDVKGEVEDLEVSEAHIRMNETKIPSGIYVFEVLVEGVNTQYLYSRAYVLWREPTVMLQLSNGTGLNVSIFNKVQEGEFDIEGNPTHSEENYVTFSLPSVSEDVIRKYRVVIRKVNGGINE